MYPWKIHISTEDELPMTVDIIFVILTIKSVWFQESWESNKVGTNFSLCNGYIEICISSYVYYLYCISCILNILM